MLLLERGGWGRVMRSIGEYEAAAWRQPCQQERPSGSETLPRSLSEIHTLPGVPQQRQSDR